MFLAELKIENFRIFGEGTDAMLVSLRPGLTALVGENDTGKSAIMDAIRFALGTRDQEFLRLEETDFHQPRDGSPRKTEIKVRCKFSGLTASDKAAFAEHLTYIQEGPIVVPTLYLNWRAVAGLRANRRFTTIEVKSGRDTEGPAFEQEVRTLLCTTYLRPLRDAERALSAGRGSRLSQILQHTKEIKEHGADFDHTAGPPDDPFILSVLGIADLANALLGGHQGIRNAQDRLNAHFLSELSFAGNALQGHISVSGSRGDIAYRRRQLLEKLELDLRDTASNEYTANRGLGSNNLLFMACELLLLGSEPEVFPLLLVEEPEAHLHPQRQLRLIDFLQRQTDKARSDGQSIQVIVTTHSPNLASAIALENLVLLTAGKAFPLTRNDTNLDGADYAFLRRFLDVTKANLFFARSVVIVEGDAENILLPTVARLLGRDFTSNGVSVVNVGGVGLRRFARIFQRKNADSSEVVPIPVACITDMDVMPDCAPEIMGNVEASADWPAIGRRRWRAKRDYPDGKLQERRDDLLSKASGQYVKSFVSDEWTLEYDLAYFGLETEVWLAAHVAKADEALASGVGSRKVVIRTAFRSLKLLRLRHRAKDVLASSIYAFIVNSSGLSKVTVAQYLAQILESRCRAGRWSPDELRQFLPPYISDAIAFVTPAVSAAPATPARAGTAAG